MADSRILLAGLEEYRRVLTQHLVKLTANYQRVDSAWHLFSGVYEGTAADEFRAGWVRTAQQFQEYIEQTQQIRLMLDERIEHLRAADQVEGGIPR